MLVKSTSIHVPSANSIHTLVIVVKETVPYAKDNNQIQDNGQKINS